MTGPIRPAAPGQGEERSPYAGRWVARLRGRVVGHGGTPQQALRAAQVRRFKEVPEIRYMPPQTPLQFPPLLDEVRNVLPEDIPAYLVGGAVRDAALGRAIHDLDFAVASGGLRLARRVADSLHAHFYPLDRERDTGRVVIIQPDNSRLVLDFASFRGPDLEADLGGRDFTVNALALDLRTMAVHDPLGGLADLRAGQLRACSATAFTDDPLRIIRGVRQAAAYGFQVHPETHNAMKQANPGLREVSPERLRDELARMLAGLHQAACLQALDRLGALDAILPELEGLKGMEQPAPHVHDGWQHTVATLAHLEGILSILSPGFDPETANDLFTGMLAQRLGRYRLQLAAHLDESLVPGRSVRSLLSLAAIYHDIAKPPSRSVDESGRLRFLGHDEQGSIIAAARLRALQFSGPEVERVETIIRNHMRVHFHVNRLAREGKPPTRRGLYRFFRDTGQAGVETILLSLADLRATYEETLTQETWAACLDICRLFLENLWEKPKEAVAPPAILDGEGLMKALGLSPGPRVGFLLENIREAQATGKVRSRREALAHGRATLRRIESGQVRESILVDGARLYFFQRPGSGMPLVLLHGFPLDHCIWQPLLPFLPAGVWLLTPDLRGHGLSDSPPGMYTMASMADDLAAILGYLRIRRAVVVGHSMGGYVALAFAQAHTGLLAGLGLVASRATADSAEQRLTRQQLAERVQSEGVQALVDAMLHKMTASSKAAGRVRELFLKTQPAGAAGSLLGMAGRPDTSSLVASLPVPVMLLAGSRDLLIPPEQALCKGIESGTLRRVELPEAGHLPMMEFPAETAGAIARLLREAK